jgi:23S rRNA (pseudouridine1915-N3)-methyltransferase
LAEREVREAARAGTPALRQREESGRLARAIPAGATIIALDREGSAWSSEQLAQRLERWRVESGSLALVIGGAFGLEAALLGRAGYRWSLGPLTLPHELARVVVLEQWYRAWTILRGEPYHKA